MINAQYANFQRKRNSKNKMPVYRRNSYSEAINVEVLIFSFQFPQKLLALTGFQEDFKNMVPMF